MTDRLSAADVARLMENPSAAVRASTAAKIAAGFNDMKLSPTERSLAEEIFRVLMGDHVEPRREFIEKHALDVRDLDI